MRHFLSLLWPGSPHGYVSLWVRSSVTEQSESRHYLLGDERIYQDVAQADAEGLDVYVGAGLRREDFGPHARGTKSDVVLVPGFWADFDIRGPAHKAHDLPGSLEEVCDALEDVPAEPTLIVDSGHGLHVWWLFAAPRAPDEAAAKAWEELVLGVWAKRGWRADKVADAARVLRLPGTRNHKISPPVPVVTVLADGPRHELAFLAARARTSASRVATSQAPQVADPTMADAPVTDELAAVVARLRSVRTSRRDLIARMLAGAPLASEGSRNTVTNELCGVVAGVAKDVAPERLITLFRTSLAAMAEEAAGAPTETEVTSMLARAQAAFRERDSAAERTNQALARALIASARRSSSPNSPTRTSSEIVPSVVASSGSLGSLALATDAQDAEPPSDGAYTADEIARFAEAQRCSVEAFRHRWVVQYRSSYYVFCAGRYMRPVTIEELPLALQERLAPLPMEYWSWFAPKANGGDRRKTPKEVVGELGKLAGCVTATMSRQDSFYDDSSDTFFEAVCPVRRALRPVYDERVDQWLRLLGGLHAEKLLDWLATITDLAKPSCALYLDGRAGSGKSMLGAGLARIWSIGAPAELSKILDNFNSALLECPLVVADEHLGANHKGGVRTEDIRTLVANSSRMLSRKNLPDASLMGCVRVLLSANNSHLLNSGSEDLGAHDLEAVASRFLHIDVGEAPRDYLVSIGGRKGTDGWVDEDVIAQHALWLRDHRAVSAGDRFLVEGELSAVYHQMATQSATAIVVMEWVVRMLDDPNKSGVLTKKLVMIGGGHLLVAARAITDMWRSYLPESRMPAMGRITRTMAQLSSGDPVRRGGLRYHDLRVDLVLAAAEELQIGDVDKMRERIEQVFAAVQ